MKRSEFSSTRFIAVTIGSVVGMLFYFSVYLETTQSEYHSGAAIQGLLVLLVVTIYWAAGGIVIGKKHAHLAGRKWQYVFATLFVLGLLVLALVRGWIANQQQLRPLINLGFWMFLGETLICAELLRLYLAIKRA